MLIGEMAAQTSTVIAGGARPVRSGVVLK